MATVTTYQSACVCVCVCIGNALNLQVTRVVVTEVTERHHDTEVLCAISHSFAYWTSLTGTYAIFLIVEWYHTISLCYACIRSPVPLKL